MVLGIGTALANMMTKGFQSPVYTTPKEYDLPFEDVEFRASDGVTIRGWLVGDPSSTKVIIQSHFGIQCCRAGYTPEGKGMMALHKDKLEFLKAVPTYVANGYAVLMYDFRNHGTSDKGVCEFVSWGNYEALDVVAAVDFCASTKGFKDIALLSICMGGASTTVAYGLEEGLAKFDDKIKAMVFVQPLTYKQMTANMGMPSLLTKMSKGVINKRLGYDLAEVSFFDHASKITVPTMVIQNTNDNFHKKQEVMEFYNSLQMQDKEIVWLDLEKGRVYAYVWLTTEEGAKQVVSWFNKFIG